MSADDEAHRLTRRIITRSFDQLEVSNALAKLTREERAKALMVYAEDPERDCIVIPSLFLVDEI